MKCLGLVTEYNPFHNGHLHHLREAKRICDGLTIAVMSGNFVQRGEVAIVNKYERAQVAVMAGVDLVVELPMVYTIQQASVFASQAIKILAYCGISDLVFGSECNDIALLNQVAKLPLNVDHFKEVMASGDSYIRALNPFSDGFASNDILAIAYLKALNDYPQIQAHCIQRIGGYHDLSLTEMASAKAIRNAWFNHRSITSFTPLANAIADYGPNQWADYYPLLRHILLTASLSTLRHIFMVSEGIEMHLIKCAKACHHFDDFIHMATTKRYTTSRIQRTCLFILMNISKKDMAELEKDVIIHPLAFNQKGADHLKWLKANGKTIVSRINQFPSHQKDIYIKSEQVYYELHDDNMLKHQSARFVRS